jgi:hypothetical protein
MFMCKVRLFFVLYYLQPPVRRATHHEGVAAKEAGLEDLEFLGRYRHTLG